jgi:hypothetical protein
VTLGRTSNLLQYSTYQLSEKKNIIVSSFIRHGGHVSEERGIKPGLNISREGGLMQTTTEETEEKASMKSIQISASLVRVLKLDVTSPLWLLIGSMDRIGPQSTPYHLAIRSDRVMSCMFVFGDSAGLVGYDVLTMTRSIRSTRGAKWYGTSMRVDALIN